MWRPTLVWVLFHMILSQPHQLVGMFLLFGHFNQFHGVPWQKWVVFHGVSFRLNMSHCDSMAFRTSMPWTSIGELPWVWRAKEGTLRRLDSKCRCLILNATLKLNIGHFCLLDVAFQLFLAQHLGKRRHTYVWISSFWKAGISGSDICQFQKKNTKTCEFSYNTCVSHQVTSNGQVVQLLTVLRADLTKADEAEATPFDWAMQGVRGWREQYGVQLLEIIWCHDVWWCMPFVDVMMLKKSHLLKLSVVFVACRIYLH